MASTRDIRRRIKSVKNTAQITKAMQMVAASKMRRAQQAALAGRPYSELMNQVLASLKQRVDPRLHPLLAARPVQRRCVLLLSTDKGLCGGLNTNLMREAAKFDAGTTAYITWGRKARQFIARTKRNLLADFEQKETPTYAEGRAVGKMLTELYLEGEIDQIDILFTHYISTLRQEPQTRQLLPIVQWGVETKGDIELTEPEFEPAADVLLETVLPQYINMQVYQLMLESKASEHSARMVAMKNATDNAKELIDDLTLTYNKIRQAGITKELLEITTAQMALE